MTLLFVSYTVCDANEVILFCAKVFGQFSFALLLDATWQHSMLAHIYVDFACYEKF